MIIKGSASFTGIRDKIAPKDETVVVDGLAQAAQIVKELGWCAGKSIYRNLIKPATWKEDFLSASKELGFN